MTRIAVLGANGQVGAELCLLLARAPGVELVPVCRTVSGSAFLRHHGIAVRHGSVAAPHDAPRLIGDCAIVVNAALATGTPQQMRRTEDAIIGSALHAAPRGARIIHFSTQSVYGDPRPGRWLRLRNPYGRAKVATEATARRIARAQDRALFVLRLGHVCGALQGISMDLRQSLRRGTVAVPPQDLPSNTVYTASVADAVLRIAAGEIAPGVYDLMNAPQLTWREVLGAEARIAGCACEPRVTATPDYSAGARLRRSLRRVLGFATSPAARSLATALLTHAPARLNERAQAHWHRVRAAREIAALSAPAAPPPEHFSWRANGSRFMAALTPTLDLLAGEPYRDLLAPRRAAWPADLPDAAAISAPQSQALRSTAT